MSTGFYRRTFNKQIAALALSTCLATTVDAQDVRRLTVVQSLSPGLSVEPAVTELSLAVSSFSRGTLGIERRISVIAWREQDLVSAVQNGDVDLALVGTSLGNVVEDFKIFDLPYLLHKREDLNALTNGLVIPVMAPRAREVGVDVLALLDGGFNQINSRKPIERLEDFEGLRIGTFGLERTGKSRFDPNREFFYRLRADPIVLATSETPSISNTPFFDAMAPSLPWSKPSRA
jgi:TRAP-type C4-dicarboxylate transport system substrate-binding protein